MMIYAGFGWRYKTTMYFDAPFVLIPPSISQFPIPYSQNIVHVEPSPKNPQIAPDDDNAEKMKRIA